LLSIPDDAKPTRLARVLIEPAATGRIQRELRALGLTKTTLFPEAQSVAEDLKRLYKLA
jgi:hypothetical protein